MRKKLLSLLLTFALLLSLCPAALAAEGDVRETGFFTDQEHADVNYEDMEYKHIDAEPILAEMEEVRALLDDEANAEAVEEHFNAFADQFMEVLTMYQLINIKTYQDVTDEEAAAELEYTDTLYMTVVDALILFIQDILESPCAAFLEEQLTEEDIAYYLEYEAMTEEQISQSAQETALENEYMSAAYLTYTAEYEGQEWDDSSVNAAYAAGELDEETFNAISRAIAKNQNAALGDIYLRMVALRQDIAGTYGYDNYADYAYTEIYQRDYTKEEIRSFHTAVKENMVPLYNALLTLYYSEYDDPVFTGDYTSEIALDMIEPYIAQLSSELLESFTYMRDHGLYDSGFSDTKGQAGFTTMLYSYGAPFYFNSPYGDLYDFTTAVHEFGHYNNFYWQPSGWNDSGKSIDLAEVHSQGLELLFSHFYPEIFGEESGQAVLDYQLLNLTSAIIQGALHDELQQFVYTTGDVTLDQINEEYCRLCREYGIIAEDDPRTEMYGWYTIPHTFTSPCYYISYAVSAAGAFSFWLDAQEDFFPAVDEYLQFTALDSTYGFQESFEELGMESPISAQYIEDVVDALWTALDLETRLDEIASQPEAADVAFPDVTEANWFYEYVMLLASNGLVSGYEDGTFQPRAAATRDLALEFFTGEGDGSEEPITRLELCQLLAEVLEISTEGAESPFSDTDDAAVAALAALGIVDGYEDGTFQPDQVVTRAELCVIACRAATAAAE